MRTITYVSFFLQVPEKATLSKSLGDVSADTLAKVVKELTVEEKQRNERKALRPPLSEILNLHDFEV